MNRDFFSQSLFPRFQSHEHPKPRVRVFSRTRISLLVSFANRADRKVFGSFFRDAGFFERLVDERAGVEVRFSVFSMKSEIRRSSKPMPKRGDDGRTVVRFRYPAFHERLRKRVEPEFVAARLGERGDERFEVAGDGVSEDGFHPVDGLPYDVFGRSFPSRMDERGEVDVRIAVRKADDGAIRGSEENSDVLPERLLGNENQRIAVSGIGIGRFAVEKRYRILADGMRPSVVS